MSALLTASRLGRGLALLSAMVFAVGTLSLTLPGTAESATAATSSDSSVTIKWTGGNDPSIQQYQPDHAALTSDGAGNDNGSGHWSDFKNLQISVSKTQGLKDEVVQISSSGLVSTAGYPAGWQNFLQVMQCWGPDPNAADFVDTCVWGGVAESGTPSNEFYQASIQERVSGVRGGIGELKNPSDTKIPANGKVIGAENFWHFRSADGSRSEPFYVESSAVPGTVFESKSGLTQYYDATTTNEKVAVPTGTGTTTMPFYVQNAASASYLGCGAQALAGSRCWLVVVPRGTHSGTREGDATNTCDRTNLSAWGSVRGNQAGSPIDAQCSFWDDRIVVPLDFQDAFASCPSGSVERRLVGTELMNGALSSWQGALCNAEGGAVYSTANSSGNVNRAQLVTGLSDFVVTPTPVTTTTIGSADPSLLDERRIGYAPIANTSLVIGFVSNAAATDLPTGAGIKLTPRILAKLVTQSYKDQLPTSISDSQRSPLFADATRAQWVQSDPEWIALGNPTGARTQGAYVVIGPQGDDAIALLWQYMQSDDDARAFLQGKADPWGMTINPNYLPAGNPNAMNGGLKYDVATGSLDVFPRADPMAYPDKATAVAMRNGTQVDSVTLLPFSANFAANGSRIFHVDTKWTANWDPDRNGGLGGWKPLPLESAATGKLVFGPVDASTAANLQLRTASLQLPNSTTFVAPTDASVSAATTATTVDPATGVATTDFSSLPADAYPLAMTLYGAIDTTPGAVDAKARTDYAALLDYASGPGNVPGTNRGELPAGYVPLTTDQIARARSLAAVLRSNESVGEGIDDSPSGTTAPSSSVTSTAAQVAAMPATQTGVSPSASTLRAEATAAAGSPAQGVLGILSVLGALGLASTPLLLRRRRLGG